jgi:hypothetical protein
MIPGMRAAVALLPIFASVQLRAEGVAVELAVVVNAQNHAAVSAMELENIFLLRRRQWPDGTPILPFNAPPGEVHRTGFDRAALRMSADEAARYWLDLRIRSGTRAPRQLADPGLAVRLVARLKGAIAYVPVDVVDSSVRVVARVRGGKVLPP